MAFRFVPFLFIYEKWGIVYLMANFCIITNNPLVAHKYPDVSTYGAITVTQVLVAARNSIHKGARLINHPLSGSVKPNQSPYKSLVLSLEETLVDFKSLQLIEGAQAVLKKLPVKNTQYTNETAVDYQVIDLDLLDSAIHALPAEYYF